MKEKQNGEKSARVPRLRFPEFLCAGEWERKELGDALRPSIREVNKPKCGYVGLGIRSHGKGTFQKPDQEPEKNSMDKLFQVHRDDLVVSITFAWEGAIAVANDGDHGCYVSHRFPTYTFNADASSPAFFRYVITNRAFVYKLGLISPGGAGRNRVMNKNDFLHIPVLLPIPSEQQKIADCLSSLDELITAETQKLHALKTHKKGLMQQLFPREGETVPRLRFPEFRDAGEWEARSLESVSNGISSGKDKSDTEGLFDLYGSTGVIGKTSTASYSGEFILVARVGANAGLLTKSAGQFGVTDNTLVIHLSDEVNLSFVFHCLDDFGLNKLIFGSGQPLITGGQLKALSLHFPSDAEQQKITALLASLDDLITDQNLTVNTLKTHKKALMQQLFPVLDEVHA